MHTLPDLPYGYDALEPAIDTRTMEIHHTKHHQGYVDKLNAALEGNDDLVARDLGDLLAHLDDVPENVRIAVRNNGGGHYNHSLFWKIMSPASSDSGAPNPPADGALHEALARDLGGFEAFKKMFTDAALARFGSGWAWLSIDHSERLHVESTPNQDNPLMLARQDLGDSGNGGTPILGLDLWEHAYYLKYQNKRADYVAAWWNIVNWTEVETRYSDATNK